jgi:hypothetical protein
MRLERMDQLQDDALLLQRVLSHYVHHIRPIESQSKSEAIDQSKPETRLRDIGLSEAYRKMTSRLIEETGCIGPGSALLCLHGSNRLENQN